MNKKEFMESVLSNFNKIAEEIKDTMIPARVLEAEDGVPGPVLTVIYDEMGPDGDEVMGDYSVIVGENEEDTVAYIESFLTFTEELSNEHLPELYEAISKLNFFLPFGGFTINEAENVLGYKFGMPISMDLTDEGLYGAISLCMTGGFIQANNYVFPLMQISEGKMTLDEVLELVRGAKEE